MGHITDLRNLDPTELRNRLLKKSHQPNLPNATYTPTPELSLPYAVTMMPVGSAPAQAHIAVKITSLEEHESAKPKQVYTERGVFEDAIALKTLSLPMSTEISNILKLYALASYEGNDSKDWCISMLGRLGVPTDTAHELLARAPKIRSGVTRPFLRPDTLRDRVVYGRHNDSYRIEVSVAGMNPRVKNAAISYEELKAYAASLALNLTVDAPAMIGYTLTGAHTVLMQVAVPESASAPLGATGTFLPLPEADALTLRATDFERSATELANMQASNDALNPRVDAILARLAVVDSAVKQDSRMRTGHNSSLVVGADRRARYVTKVQPAPLPGKPAQAVKDAIQRSVARLATHDKRVRDLLTAAAMSTDEELIQLMMANRPVMARLVPVISSAITGSTLWADEENRWGYCLTLLYSGQSVLLSSTNLEDHVAAAFTTMDGAPLIRRLIRSSASDLASVGVDPDNLALLGFLLAAEGHDIMGVQFDVVSRIMEQFQRRYRTRASHLATMVKNAAPSGMLRKLSKDQANTLLQNAKGRLIELQWLAFAFEIHNMNLVSGKIRKTDKLKEHVERVARSYVRKRAKRDDTYRGPGSGHGSHCGTVMLKAATIADTSRTFEDMASGLDELIGTNFSALGKLLQHKMTQAWRDAQHMAQSYQDAVSASKRGPDHFAELAVDALADKEDLVDLASARAILSRATYMPSIIPTLNQTDAYRVEQRDAFPVEGVDPSLLEPAETADIIGMSGSGDADDALLLELLGADMLGGADIVATELDRQLQLAEWSSAVGVRAEALQEALQDAGGHVSPTGVVIVPDGSDSTFLDVVADAAMLVQGGMDREEAKTTSQRRQKQRAFDLI